MKKKRNIYIVILLILGFICVASVFFSGNLFGSNIDWINQHVAFPNYFRDLFYQTGNLFPQFSWNLGLGQNIYNLAYYGFLNPIILISYLFPFVEMTIYVMVSSVLLYLLSIYLFYKWIEPKFELKTTILLSLLFLLAGPLFFHFHRQLMFVNYIPFLILSLIIIDKNKKNCFCLLSIMIFLMIMCSYYYSVGAIIVVFIYYIYIHYHVSWKDKIKIFIPISIGVLLSGILIIPTLYTILSGRSSIGESVNIWTLIIPDFKFDQILYGSYALGLTAITIPSLVSSVMHKKNSIRFLGMALSILIVFPVFRYLLNGGLYIRSKALIPFLPLFLLVIGNFLEDSFLKKIDYRKVLKVTLIITLLSLLTGYFHFAYYIDLLITMLVLYYCCSHHKQKSFYILLSLFSFVLFIAFQFTEDFVDKDKYDQIHQNDTLIEKRLEKDNTVYRFSDLVDTIDNINWVYRYNDYKSTLYSSTYNDNYYNFYHDILNSNNDTYNHLMLADANNIISHRLFGSKYVLSQEKLGWGYQLLESEDDVYLYTNMHALSIGYASSNVYNSEYFYSLPYPKNLEMLLTGIVVENSNNTNNYQGKVEVIDNEEIKLTFGDYISISHMDEYALLEVTKDSNITITFDKPIKEKILFIEVQGLERNSCNIEDIGIEIDGISNTLSCDSWRYSNGNHIFHFVLNEDEASELVANIKPGTYKITGFNIYQMDRSVLNHDFDEMKNIKISDNQLTGNIQVSSDSYMALSIPYDNGFKVKIDNAFVDYEKVNGSFIGFPISKGTHTIDVTFESPWYRLGIISSIVGFIFLIGYYIHISVCDKFTKREK